MRRRSVPLGVTLLVLQVTIVLVTTCAAGLLAAKLQSDRIRQSYMERMLSVAESVARLPTVVEAFDSPNPSETIHPLAELIRNASQVTYVVVTDRNGVRYSHPDPARIGEHVSTDPSTALAGQVFVGTETGTLGTSLRAKVPIRSASGEIIGMASVGILESALDDDLAEDLPELIGWLAAAALVGVLGSALVTRMVRRRTFRLEPAEIAQLLETRDAMLHGIREGVVAVDEHERVALVNDEAVRLLGLTDDPTGRPAAEVLEDGGLLDLARGVDDVADRLVLAGERVLVANRMTARTHDRRVGVVLTLRDRTELHDALRELDGQRTVTEVLRAQAHEFTNHLHVISGLVELDRREEAVRYIERVGGAGSVTSEIIGGAMADPALAALLLAKSSTAHERGVALRLAQDSRVVARAGDDALTVLGNLVDNAVDAVDTGGTVRVLVRSDGEGVRVVVEDDGPGVAEADRDRIFTLGVSSKAPRGAHGRGIGLALVSRVVTRRRGRVRVSESELGGAAFDVWLPEAGAR
ncbi:ATP-binding protein [Saccharothrix coeruleofusca]|uniref:histidine kinase n=1 Tax=Saccharothrix coeruleofusca TaxID=33919 RepID=A0A918ALR3_9PSEU|nr:sensor histidine kinase [Saccharothrix coeruleofusca]MBP2336287.1 two-component system CitB family sensor kinase [Saccharothrix coeruleofusca]GGP54129.1 histidine kinase [Saccharothrix coeruleofusca]